MTDAATIKTMSQDAKEDPKLDAGGHDLEPYRRLVDLQKQMIAMAQQHDDAKRKRDALHAEMARDIADRQPRRPRLRHRLRQSAAKLLKFVPGFLAG